VVADAGADGLVRVTRADPEDLIALRVRSGDAVNVPQAVEIGIEGKTTIRVAKENAVRLAGRVADAAGKPVPDAKVGIYWSVWGVGKSSKYGQSRLLETVRADADGRYTSSALWPTDEYWVTVSADGFA